MEALAALRGRRSVRRFRDQVVERALIEEILDCGRLAATARNVQPWSFIVVQEAEKRAQLAETTAHGKFLAQAPVAIAVYCEETTYYLEDGAAATQNILLGAYALGLGACWVAGDKKPYAAEIGRLLGAPEAQRLVSLVALGYPEQRPKPVKKALATLVHWEQW